MATGKAAHCVGYLLLILFVGTARLLITQESFSQFIYDVCSCAVRSGNVGISGCLRRCRNHAIRSRNGVINRLLRHDLVGDASFTTAKQANAFINPVHTGVCSRTDNKPTPRLGCHIRKVRIACIYVVDDTGFLCALKRFGTTSCKRGYTKSFRYVAYLFSHARYSAFGYLICSFSAKPTDCAL